MEEKLTEKPENELIDAVNFAMQKFLVQAGTVEAEGKILEKQLHDLKTKVQLKKIKAIIQKH